MLPLGDDLARGWRYPGTFGLIGLLVLCALVQWTFGQAAVDALGFHPIAFSQRPWLQGLQLVTSVFLHGGWLHLLGNVLFLWVFGRALEGLFGWRWFTPAFPVLGLAGNLAYWIANANSAEPVIGASGAIAALMGAYLALFPAARVRLLVWVGVPIALLRPRAWIVLSIWIAGQLGAVLMGFEKADGVAYLVHAGGFAVGLIGAIVWKVLSVGGEEKLAIYLETQNAAAGALIKNR